MKINFNIITSLVKVFNQKALKYTFGVVMFFCLVACDSTVVKFQNKAKGKNPKNLIGKYQLKIIETDTSYFDMISIERTFKSNYIIKSNNVDTLYNGEIRKKNN